MFQCHIMLSTLDLFLFFVLTVYPLFRYAIGEVNDEYNHYANFMRDCQKTRLFAQPFVKAQTKENIKVPRH